MLKVSAMPRMSWLRGGRLDEMAVAVVSEVGVDIVAVADGAWFCNLMQAYHYLGAMPGMGGTMRCVS